MKVCVSSRPWNNFKEVFGQDESRKIYMEGLTKSDIQNYVPDTFEADSSFQELIESGEECQEIVNDIVNSANGVFLRVHLVVQSLLEGITNVDRMVDLQRRLNALPTDLKEVFERIISTVDTFYWQRTAHFFQVAIGTSVRLPLMIYWFMDQEDPQYSMKLDVNPFSIQGLLEAQFYDSTDAREGSLPSSVLFNFNVDFMHRTARDFLRAASVQGQLDEWTATDFQVDSIICAAILAQAKSAPQETEYFTQDGPIERLRTVFHFHYRQRAT